eukprot:c19792_g1_i1 orf=694-4953(-)
MQSPASSRKRGFLRPAPPVPSEPAPFAWKGGLFVDVFFQDAWWEAVLLDDVVSLEENAYVSVIYPDEGDLAQVRVKDLRISQLWDEVTGTWNMKGSCNLSRFLKRRGISRKEVMQTSSPDFEGSQVDLHQISSVQSNSKLYDRVCSFFDMGLPGCKDMTYYVQARAPVLGEECNGGTKSSCSGQQPDLDHSSNDKIISQEPQHLTCPENGNVDAPSFASQLNNLVEATGFTCRNEVAAYEGPECIKDDANPCIDGIESREVGMPVFERETADGRIETLSAQEVISNGMESQRSSTEIYVSTCGGEGESLASPSLLPNLSSQVEGSASPCDKQEDSLVSCPLLGISSSQKEFYASSREKEANSLTYPHSLASSLTPQGKLSMICCREETDTVASTPCLTVCSPERYQHLVCESKHRQGTSLMEEFVDGTKCFESQKSDGEANLSSREEEVKAFMFSAYLAMSNSQEPSYSICEAKQQELGFGMGKFFERDDAHSRSNVHKKVPVVMDAGNSICLSTPSQTGSFQQPVEVDKLDYLEEAALTCSDRDCAGGQQRLEKITKLMEPRVDVDFNNKKLGCEKEMPLGKTQVIPVEVDSQVKRKENSSCQERVLRTRLRDKHRDHGSSCDEKIERGLETDTLRSFRDRLVRQKQAEAVKRKALETRRGVEKGEKVGKKIVNPQLFNKKLNHTGTTSMSSLKASDVTSKSLRFLTRDIAQKALLEAGFTIDLRPRRSRNYQDAVYMSPEGHSYWSLPKAWDALKKAQAKKSLISDGQGCSKNTHCVAGGRKKGTMSNMHGEEMRQSLAKADKRALKQVFSRFGKDERLQAALSKLDTCSGTHVKMAQNITRQAELTNADLTDILLGELGVLRRFTKKFLRKNKLNKINPADSKAPKSTAADFFGEKRGIKRKQDSAYVFETSDRRMLDGRGFSSKLHGDSSRKSREDKKQGTARCLKQAAIETKLTVSKHKAKKGKKPKARSGFRLEVRRPGSSGCEEPTCHTKRTVFAWMLDRGAVLEREKIFFVDQINNQVLKEGIVTREGILCSCCKRVYTIDSFEAHAGRHLGDWHQALIFTSGKRLLDCQLKAWDAEIHLRKAHNYIGVTEDDTNDDSCVLCGDGGDLICCDGCPSTFHASCLQMDNVPEGNWYCPKCSCGTCGGRQHGEKQENAAVILCNQCEHRYHIACLRGGHSIVEKAVFCGPSCEKIFSSLRGLIGIAHPLGGGFSWTLLRCMEEDKATQLINDTEAIDCHSKLAVALLIIKECFNPMVDPRTNIDMITHAMYNRWSDFDRLNYGGFYTAVLEKDGEMISVASIRIHGARLAEMPLIGTREKYRRQGMCRLLVGVIEKLLCSLEVAFFILPAIPELFETWTHAFGFKPLDPWLKSDIMDISMMVFPGTELLQKPLSASSMRDAVVLHEPRSESDCT